MTDEPIFHNDVRGCYEGNGIDGGRSLIVGDVRGVPKPNGAVANNCPSGWEEHTSDIYKKRPS